ncbi:DUF687 family protein [Chlamydiifrater phoenicopteri]|uniref:DUF687 family protein n=1 Tax=Chlamydiifrater phoenicopteri TaxID=2681469 RepID=UPI001BCB3FAA|nr:DUF687 family protein [Chlamydiifrater phoenicopteri]
MQPVQSSASQPSSNVEEEPPSSGEEASSDRTSGNDQREILSSSGLPPQSSLQHTAETIRVLTVGESEGRLPSSTSYSPISEQPPQSEELIQGIRVCTGSTENNGELQDLLGSSFGEVCIVYVNDSGTPAFEALSAGCVLSECCGGHPVNTVLNEGVGFSCSRPLHRLRCPRYHPQVLALHALWMRFLETHPEGIILQIFDGDGGAFVEAALEWLSLELRARVHVLGLNPAHYPMNALEAVYYRTSLHASLYDRTGYLTARADNRISTVPYSALSTSFFPSASDDSFQLGIRMAFLRCTGRSGFTSTLLPGDNTDGHSFALVSLIEQEESQAFQRLMNALEAGAATSVRNSHPPVNGNCGRLMLMIFSLFRQVVGNVFRASVEVDLRYHPMDVAYASFYTLGATGELIIFCTNGRAASYRLLRMLARLWCCIGDATFIAEYIHCIYNLRVVSALPTPNPCVQNLLIWVIGTGATPFAFWWMQQRFPRLYHRTTRLALRYVSPQEHQQELVEQRGGPFDQNRRNAFGTTVGVMCNLIYGVGFAVLMGGLDLFNWRFPENCRPCNNSTLTNTTANTTTPTPLGNCTEPLFNLNGTFTEVYQNRSLHKMAITVRIVWCFFMMIYLLFVVGRTLRQSRRRR